MARSRRAIVPLDAEVTSTRTEAEVPVPDLASPVVAVEAENAPVQHQRSPARQRLADALQTVKALQAEIATASTAVDEARQQDAVATSAFYNAESDLERALPGFKPRPPSGADEGEMNAFYAWINSPPMPVADARAAVAVAQDERDTARRALEFHRDKLDALIKGLGYRKWDIESAVKAVLAAEPAAIDDLLTAARRRFLDYQDAVYIVSKIENVERSLTRRVPAWDTPDRSLDMETRPLTYAWLAALEALQSDPDAPLPMSV